LKINNWGLHVPDTATGSLRHTDLTK